MADPLPKGMTVEEFIPWAMARPETEHYELMAGEVVAMAPERVGHTRAKTRIWRLLTEAIETVGPRLRGVQGWCRHQGRRGDSSMSRTWPCAAANGSPMTR